jgi:HAD superfamily hydrolase (TIGR01662 family)
MEDPKLDLIVFDCDGTLADRATGELLPRVAEFFAKWQRQGCRPAIALATNQGGPACRDKGFRGDYPTVAEVEAKYAGLAQVLGIPQSSLYISLVYGNKDGSFLIPKNLAPDDPRLNPQWRKPHGGMLVVAMEAHRATPGRTLMVGDRPEDRAAADAAGCWFVDATDFFKETNNVVQK